MVANKVGGYHVLRWVELFQRQCPWVSQELAASGFEHSHRAEMKSCVFQICNGFAVNFFTGLREFRMFVFSLWSVNSLWLRYGFPDLAA